MKTGRMLTISGLAILILVATSATLTLAAQTLAKNYQVVIKNKSGKTVDVHVYSSNPQKKIIVKSLRDDKSVKKNATIAGKRRLKVYRGNDKVTDDEFFLNPAWKRVTITIKKSGNYEIDGSGM